MHLGTTTETRKSVRGMIASFHRDTGLGRRAMGANQLPRPYSLTSVAFTISEPSVDFLLSVENFKS